MATVRSISSEEWDAHKTAISLLYLTENKTLREMKDCMEKNHGFYASRAQYVRQLKEWNMEKNSTSDKWESAAIQAHKRKLEGKETEILINGKLIPPKKLKKELSRYTPSQFKVKGESAVAMDIPDGLVVRTPPAEAIEFQLMSPPINDSEQLSMSPAFEQTNQDAGWFLEELLREPTDVCRLEDAQRFDSGRRSGELVQHVRKLYTIPTSDPSLQLLRYAVYLSANHLLPDSATNNLLSFIIRSGKLWVVEQLVDMKVPMTEIFASNLLVSAARMGQIEVFRVLLAKGVDPNNFGGRGAKEPPIHAAVGDGNVLLVRLLLEAKANPNARSWPFNYTPLKVAALACPYNPEIARMLIEFGADVNEPYSNKSQYPMMYPETLLGVAAKQRNIDLIQKLLKAGARINEPCEHHGTLLQIAAQDNNVELVKVLLKAGADVNSPIGKTYEDACIRAARNRHFKFLLTPLQHAVGRGNIEIVQLLLEAGADVNAVSVFDAWDGTALQIASAYGNLDLVQLLLDNGADVNVAANQPYRTTAVQGATASENTDLVKLLVDNGADINAIAAPSRGRTCLQVAAEKGDLKMFNLLLQLGADINGLAAEENGLDVLGATVEGDCVPIFERLLEEGVDVDGWSNQQYGMSILEAATQMEAYDIAQLLRGKGATFNSSINVKPLTTSVENNEGKTTRNPIDYVLDDKDHCQDDRFPLHVAAYNGNIDIVRNLIDADTRIDHEIGIVVLWLAVGQGHADIVKLLLQKGINPNQTPNYQNLPKHYKTKYILQLALEKLKHENAQFCSREGAKKGSVQTVQVLLDARADINYPTSVFTYRTALQEAIIIGNINLVECMLAAGADINAPPSSNSGRTALQAAAECGDIHLVQFLLSHKADVNAPPSYILGITALQGAAGDGDIHIVQLLLSYGADVNSPAGEFFGVTALQFAAIEGHLPIALELLEKGADVNAAAASVEGRTALEAAAEHGRLDIVYLLLENDGDVETIEERCKGAADLASSSGHLILARLLREWKKP